jgi:predicted nucleic acid-binding protein
MAMHSAPITVVCDAGPVIHLHELDMLDLLKGFQSLLIPHAVSEEIIQHRTIAFTDFGFTIKPDPQPDAALHEIQRIFCLHKGEMAAIGLALQNPPCLFLTDDAAARLAAHQFRVEVHGTIGILLRAVRVRQRSAGQIRIILENLREKSSLHIKKDLIELALRKLDMFQ